MAEGLAGKRLFFLRDGNPRQRVEKCRKIGSWDYSNYHGDRKDVQECVRDLLHFIPFNVTQEVEQDMLRAFFKAHIHCKGFPHLLSKCRPLD